MWSCWSQIKPYKQPVLPKTTSALFGAFSSQKRPVAADLRGPLTSYDPPARRNRVGFRLAPGGAKGRPQRAKWEGSFDWKWWRRVETFQVMTLPGRRKRKKSNQSTQPEFANLPLPTPLPRSKRPTCRVRGFGVARHVRRGSGRGSLVKWSKSACPVEIQNYQSTCRIFFPKKYSQGIFPLVLCCTTSVNSMHGNHPIEKYLPRMSCRHGCIRNYHDIIDGTW